MSHAMEGKTENIYASDAFRLKAVENLAGAVKIPTESFDTLGEVGSDPRWDIFSDLHAYLLYRFPQVHATFALTKINTFGLVYRWNGSDPSLKPLLLTAHQDVVPVAPTTVSEWTHPPYSGHYDGEWLWGRGSSDDKAGLIGILTALETLIENGFQPRRGIFVAFGFDEEIAGPHGAKPIAAYFKEQYGEDYFAMLVDEGGDIFITDGIALAMPGIGEKGYLDVQVTVASPGGHSSVPPIHTSIGYLALALQEVEAHPYTPYLSRQSPFYSTLLCLAEHAPEGEFEGGEKFRHDVKKSVSSEKALQKIQEPVFKRGKDGGKAIRALVGTTQAIDLIQGGVKVNALPEQAEAIVNHRITTDGKVQDVIDHITEVLGPVASKYNLAFTSFGRNLTTSSGPHAGSLTLQAAFGSGLQPAPITPTSGREAEAYRLLSRTIRRTFKTRKLRKGETTPKEIYVAPGHMTGNTDTRHYWALTRNIFRYDHLVVDDVQNAHTVDEAIRVDGFIEMIRFFTSLVLDADASTTL